MRHFSRNTKTEKSSKPLSSKKINSEQPNNFEKYINSFRKAKSLTKNKYHSEEEDPLQILNLQITEKEEEVISKQKLKFLEEIYDRWKNSYKMHIKGKTIRKWEKKPRERDSFEPDLMMRFQSREKDKGKKMVEDDNRIEAWK